MDKNVVGQRKLRQELNSIHFWGLKGIKVGDALAMELVHFSEWTKEDISNMEFLEIREYSCEQTGKKPKTAFYFAYTHIKRPDMREKFHAVERLVDNRLVIEAQMGKIEKNPYVGLIPLWYAQLCKLKYSPVIKLGICYQLCKAAGHAWKAFLKIQEVKTVKKVVLFHDVSGMDNILTQRCNLSGYKTFTLQHGIVNGSFDYNEYKCSHAQHLLLWGAYSKKMAIKCGKPADSIHVVGNINTLLNEPVNPDYKEKQKYFLVCTNGVVCKQNWLRNQELIRMSNAIAKKYDLQYFLKVHPYDTKNRYNQVVDKEYCQQIYDKKTGIEELLGKVRFTICGNSTTFCDSIYQNVPVFRYITESEKSIDVCKGIAFGRVEDYEALCEALESLGKDQAVYMKQLTRVKDVLFEPGDVAEKYIRSLS